MPGPRTPPYVSVFGGRRRDTGVIFLDYRNRCSYKMAGRADTRCVVQSVVVEDVEHGKKYDGAGRDGACV